MKTLLTLLAASVVLVLVPPLAAQSAEGDLDREMEALRKGQEEIRKELAEIKRLLQAQRANPAAGAAASVAGTTFDIAGNLVKGAADAQLTLVEFMDYQCGFCGRHLRETYPKIAAEYVSAGKLRYAVLDLPLERIHPLAFKAAEVTHCAADQGKFWEMHERLFANQKSLEPWESHASALGLDVAAFEACLDSDTHAGSVRHDMAEARKAGATGTPSFVLGRTDPNDPNRVTGIKFIRGARPYADFKAEIDSALEGLE